MALMAPGQWIQVDCKNSFGVCFEHDGIVVDVVPGAISSREVEVVHFAWHEHAQKRVVVKTTLEAFMEMGVSTRIIPVALGDAPEVIVKRALSQQGRADYHLFGRNCQHFGHWCVFGSAYSRQVFKFCAFGASFGLVVSLACIVGMSVARGSMW